MATTLTPRQQQIKRLLDQGKTPKQVAKQLGISENGVYQHRRRMKDGASKPAASSSRSRSRQRGSTRSTASRRRSAASRSSGNGMQRQLGAAVAPASHPQPMTPLQSVRARRDAINHELRDVRAEHEAAVKAAERAAEVLAKAETRYADELNQLDSAEAALTGQTPPKPEKPRKSGGQRRNGTGSKDQGKAAAGKAAESAPAPAGGGGEAAGGDAGPDPAVSSGDPAAADAVVEQDAAAEAPDAEFERPGVPSDPEFDQGAEAAEAFAE